MTPTTNDPSPSFWAMFCAAWKSWSLRSIRKTGKRGLLPTSIEMLPCHTLRDIGIDPDAAGAYGVCRARGTQRHLFLQPRL